MDLEQFGEAFSKLTNFQKNRFHPLVWINGEPEIGENVYIAGMSEVYAKGARVVIGDNCDIASFVAINCADSHKKCIGLTEEIDRRDIIIENNVFIGSHSVIKGGAHIGHHSVIASGTIVGPISIPPYSLVVGNPAQIKAGYYLKDNSNKTIPHNRPTLGKEEERAAIKVIRSGWVAQGTEVERFENEVCSYLGLSEGHAVAVSSGTAALFLALWVLGARNKSVALPVYSCSSLRHAVAMAHGIELLVDSGINSPNMDIDHLNSLNPEIAIVPHMYGMPIDCSNINCNKIVEDCAQAIGAKVNGIPVGLQGDIGVFSFYATKMLTSGGQGGMVVSKDKALIDQIRDYRNFDQRADKKIRFNFQMTDLQASIGREQLKKLPHFISRRDDIYRQYMNAGLPLLNVNEESNSNLLPVHYRAILKHPNPDRLIEKLRLRGINAIIPLEEWELLNNRTLFNRAIQWTKETISLPIYPSITDQEVQYVISAIGGD